MTGVPTAVDQQIEAAIDTATRQGLATVGAPGRPPSEAQHIVKYISAKYGGRYPPVFQPTVPVGLFVSPSPGFTWGVALYACLVAFPVSGAIYGRCGVVAELPSTAEWRIFDATNANTAQLYVQWAQQQPMYTMLTLTTHADWANHVLRNQFRSRFQIDVVVFLPDEFNFHYTNRKTDRWLAISEWSESGGLASPVVASRAINPRLTVILAEEFEPTRLGVGRKTLIGPSPTLSKMLPTAVDMIGAYNASNLLLVGA